MSRFSPLSYGAADTAFVPDKILIYEDEHEYEYEKNQSRSHVSALRPQPYTMKLV
jgi:hypothetical protein